MIVFVINLSGFDGFGIWIVVVVVIGDIVVIRF